MKEQNASPEPPTPPNFHYLVDGECQKCHLPPKFWANTDLCAAAAPLLDVPPLSAEKIREVAQALVKWQMDTGKTIESLIGDEEAPIIPLEVLATILSRVLATGFQPAKER